MAFRLSVMMFIQFFVWGAWYVTAPLFLEKIGFTPADFGWTYSVGPIAGIISPFIVIHSILQRRTTHRSVY